MKQFIITLTRAYNLDLKSSIDISFKRDSLSGAIDLYNRLLEDAAQILVLIDGSCSVTVKELGGDNVIYKQFTLITSSKKP
jgi:hypothetical protein